MHPFTDALSTGGNFSITNTSILRKRALVSQWPDMDALAITLEQQFVPAFDSQGPSDLSRHRNLSLAGDGRLLLHVGENLIPYFSIRSLLTRSGELNLSPAELAISAWLTVQAPPSSSPRDYVRNKALSRMILMDSFFELFADPDRLLY